MSASDMRVVPPTRRRQLVPAHLRWPVGFGLAAIVVFFFYYMIILGVFDSSVTVWVGKWFPLSTVNDCLIWVMAALGLNIVVGYAGLLDLGFVAFWAIGGYVGAWLMSGFFANRHWDFTFLSKPAPFVVGGIHLNFWLVLVIAAAVCWLMGVLIGAPTLRLRSDYLALVTLGFGEIIPQFFRNGDRLGPGRDFNLTNGTRGIQPLDPVPSLAISKDEGWELRGLFARDNLGRYLIFVLLVALILFMSLRLREGRLGRAWLAIREDELAASAMGVPLMRTKLAAYGIGAVAGGVAGVSFAVHVNVVGPEKFNFTVSIFLLVMVVLGGMGNVWGVMIGALVLEWINQTGLRQASASFNDTFGTNVNFTAYQALIFGLLLVLMMLFRREGILPEARTRLVLREPGRTEAESLGAELEQEAPELEALSDAEIHAGREGSER